MLGSNGVSLWIFFNLQSEEVQIRRLGGEHDGEP